MNALIYNMGIIRDWKEERESRQQTECYKHLLEFNHPIVDDSV